MKNVAVIVGGDSHEREISLKSGNTVISNLASDKYKGFLIVLTNGTFACEIGSASYQVDLNDFSITVEGAKILFDLAFITIHGTPGEDGKLQSYFDLIDLPYSTPYQAESTLTFNKWMCNKVLGRLGFNVAESVLLRSKEQKYTSEEILKVVGLPCFVKPNDSGSSYGVKKVNELEELIPAILYAFEHGSQVLIESFLSGTEITNPAYKVDDRVEVMEITEIVSENEFFDYEAKYQGKSSEITPARLSVEETDLVKETTKNIYLALGLKGIVRIDYMVVNHIPYVIEINTTPGLSPQSVIPLQAKLLNFELEDLFTTLITQTLK